MRIREKPEHGNGRLEAVKRVITYAFDEVNVEFLGVFTTHDNVRSKRVIERCGFQYEGENERFVCYSILRRWGENDANTSSQRE